MRKTEEKQKYEPILLELVNLSAPDIITTSVFDDESVDQGGWTQALCANEIRFASESRFADEICRTNEMRKKRISEFHFTPDRVFQEYEVFISSLAKQGVSSEF